MGNNTFELIEFDDQTTGSTFAAIPIYADNNDYPDIYVTNDFNENNELHINLDGNQLTENAYGYNLVDPFDGMGLATSDFNNDGSVEVFIANRSENGFYTKGNNGLYSNIAEFTGIYDTGWAWGASFADFNHDLFDDVYITTGLNAPEEDHYFENQAINDIRVYSEITLQSDPIFTEGGTVVSFDYDNDGDLDILATSFSREPLFYENTAVDTYYTSDIDGNWLKVQLQGTVSNRDGLGARVSLSVDDNTDLYKEYNGISFHSQSVQPLHFGLGNIGADDLTIKVLWPSGIIDEYDSIPHNSTIRIIEGESLNIIDNNTAIKISGCTDPLSCNYNPNATVDDGSCSYLSGLNIFGAEISYPLYHEEYSVTLPPDVIAVWEVTNGEIIDGQGTDTIMVKWGIATQGEVSITYSNGICDSSIFNQNVDLQYYDNEASSGTYSVARLWNEALLEAIRLDRARPTVHARNLFHVSAAMFDAWSVFNAPAHPYFLGQTVHGFEIPFDGFTVSSEEMVETAISFAAFRLLSHRFQSSFNHEQTQEIFNNLMVLLEEDINNTSLDYSNGDAAALGNYIADQIILYGLQDGSNELNDYDNLFYEPVNEPMIPEEAGNPNIINSSRWQPLAFDIFIDQSGNVLDQNIPPFLGAEWGNSMPFALDNQDLSIFYRDGGTYPVYHDPGAPPLLDATNDSEAQDYIDAFAMVAVWSSHLSPEDGVIWDISPKSKGNVDLSDLPTSISDYDLFYNYEEGGDIGTGYEINPVTDLPYEEQFVARGDYTRVLAEFWADGPDSETPPGHWFVLLNTTSDHPMMEKKYRGQGEILDDLQWDVKSYFALGGTMHDVAISAWGIKGWYDYIRPISALRYMADLGQSTNNLLSNYNPMGVPLIENQIELVTSSDPLSGASNEHLGKIKFRTWRGHDYITDIDTDEAGVGWILAENWWPYQRPTFVTPNFGGYVSGHSTFSRAAAEVMTQFTGTPYFPGGLGEFIAKKNEFLVFEEGPSEDIILQWATYRDASDQCSLSRIWGGIHPYIDDLPGRLIGEQIGQSSFEFAETYFTEPLSINEYQYANSKLFPNPVTNNDFIYLTLSASDMQFFLIDLVGRSIPLVSSYDNSRNLNTINIKGFSPGIYILKSQSRSWKLIIK